MIFYMMNKNYMLIMMIYSNKKNIFQKKVKFLSDHLLLIIKVYLLIYIMMTKK